MSKFVLGIAAAITIVGVMSVTEAEAGLFKKHHRKDCCDAAPVCAPQPVSCPAPEPVCCPDPCAPRQGLLARLKAKHAARKAKRCCADPCAAPAPCCEPAPAPCCSAPAPAVHCAAPVAAPCCGAAEVVSYPVEHAVPLEAVAEPVEAAPVDAVPAAPAPAADAVPAADGI